MKSLTQRVVALTGAASGIGEALALNFARRGAKLALSDLNEEGLERVGEECEALGASVHLTGLDVSERDAVYAWADQVASHYGQAHVIVNNAGVALHATIEETPDAIFERVMAVNFWGVVHGTRAFLPHLKRAEWGHVVNISSVCGLVAVPGQGAYNASKFAVRGFSEALTQELQLLSPHVGCTCVFPGGVRTPIVKAAAKLFLGQQLGHIDSAILSRRFDKLARTSPERAAEAITSAIEANTPRLLVGDDARLIDTLQRLLPSGHGWLIRLPYARILARERDADSRPGSV